MSDPELLIERLSTILEVLERIPRRFAEIKTPADFRSSESGLEHMDAICMVLIAAGKEFKAIDRATKGSLLERYPDVKWRGVMGVRDFLAHGYFHVNAEQLFTICRDNIPHLIKTINTMIEDLKRNGREL